MKGAGREKAFFDVGEPIEQEIRTFGAVEVTCQSDSCRWTRSYMPTELEW